MNAKELRERIGTLAWNMDFYQFARRILLTEPDTADVWQNEMWRAFQSLAKAMGKFDNAHLERILDA